MNIMEDQNIGKTSGPEPTPSKPDKLVNMDSTKGSKESTNESTTSLQDQPPFTIYTHREKVVLMLILSFIGFWSTFSSPIYFPALPTISEEFHLTSSVTDLSVVAYLVFQGIAPTFSGNFADTLGRRPVIMASMLIFIAANIAISQTNVYWLLTFLRCVQAIGIAPTIAISLGVSGDICTAADRGGFVGTVSGLQLTGNAFGGLVGAALISGFGWRGIFVFLAIGSGVTLIIISFILPETVRTIVGNGSVPAKSFLNYLPIFLLNHYKKRLTNDVSTLSPKKKLDLLAPFKILVHKETICVLFPAGIQFASWTMVLTSLTLLEGDGYNYSVLKVGFIYLPQGVTCFIGSILTGKCLDMMYRYRKNQHDLKYHDVKHKPKFNALKARIIVSIPPIIMSFVGLVIFGWCLQFKKNISSIIISTCLVSFSSTALISICTTIIVDLHPSKGSTSASLMNLVRCLLAALGTGVLSKMTKAMGLGGCYTFWAAMGLFSDLLLLVVLILKRKEHK